jgi:hypothetical protein
MSTGRQLIDPGNHSMGQDNRSTARGGHSIASDRESEPGAVATGPIADFKFPIANWTNALRNRQSTIGKRRCIRPGRYRSRF